RSAEEPVHEAGGGGAVVQGAVAPPEGGVGVAMAVGDVVQAVQRVGDLAGLPQPRTGRLVGQVEITAAQLVLVELQVGCEEQNGAAGDGEIEHRRGIVGDEHVGGEVQVGEVGIPGDVDDAFAGGGRAVGEPVVLADQHGVRVAEAGGELRGVQGEFGLPGLRQPDVLAPGRKVEGDPAA